MFLESKYHVVTPPHNGKGAQIVKYKETEAGQKFGNNTWGNKVKKEEIKLPEAVVSELLTPKSSLYRYV